MAVIVLSLFTYFERPDYNLPLFAFVILLWDHSFVKQKTRLWYLIAVSSFVDFVISNLGCAILPSLSVSLPLFSKLLSWLSHTLTSKNARRLSVKSEEI
jgi:hypothetical protein